MNDTRHPADVLQRQAALDTTKSFIVQAPAGSGKTELLTQRVLALLARVNRPEEILAITFTRKAAAEMRSRLVRALHDAAHNPCPEEAHKQLTWQLARDVLEHDQANDWQLLRNPNRMQLVTIDGFCAHLVRRMPWLSRFGAAPMVCEDPSEDYHQAAERLLLHGLAGSKVRKHVALLLRHLDNRLDLLRDLIVVMLSRRDQWLRHLLQHRGDESRTILEDSLKLYVDQHLSELDTRLTQVFKDDLHCLAVYASQNLDAGGLNNPLNLLTDSSSFPDPVSDHLQLWLQLAELLLTKSGEPRNTVTKALGFPVDGVDNAREMKERMLALLETFKTSQSTVDLFRTLRTLPHISYFDHQWRVLESLVELLPVAAAELDLVFREKGRVDFIAIASGARLALGESASPEELLLQLDSRISHILVDEFQDTSFGQYELLELLVSGWQPGDGRSLFLVGDPMQSIYRFREAEVGLYLRTMSRGIADVELEPLHLTTNFRSQADLVAWNNALFKQLFPDNEHQALGAVVYSDSTPWEANNASVTTDIYITTRREDRREAEIVADSLTKKLKVNPDETHAILVRSRNHALEVAALLKQRGITFQAQELEPLTDRQPILDVMALTKALLHPGDRLSWLSVLRAPWCGLSLEALVILCDSDKYSPLWSLIQEPARRNWLATEDRERLQRFVDVVDGALSRRGREPLSRLVFSTWLALGGGACYGPADCEDVRQFVQMISNEEAGGDLLHLDRIETALSRLYTAPDPDSGPQVQIMTIHKAKGLEFDHVYLPGLGRQVRGMSKDLLRWFEHPVHGLMLAPLPPRAGQVNDATYAAIGNILSTKDHLETVRLFYVACTRAAKSLTLCGHAEENDGGLKPAANSLLAIALPGLPQESLNIIDDSKDGEQGEGADSCLRRLPLEWEMPTLVSPPRVDRRKQVAASEHDEVFEAAAFEASNERRFVGTIVHAWLENVARDGLSHWPETKLIAQKKRITHQLQSLGFPGETVVNGAAEVIECLLSATRGKNGTWVLKDHELAECEIALGGVVGEAHVDAVIDRTFIDEQGTRWVIDYKTSSPAAGESREKFIERETERYQKQVETYVSLFHELEPARRIVGALYFPWIDTLSEVVIVEN